MTKYIVLRAHTAPDVAQEDVWEPVGSVLASSPRRAISAQVAGDEGRYVAVPARSWRPLTVTVEQTTKVTIG